MNEFSSRVRVVLYIYKIQNLGEAGDCRVSHTSIAVSSHHNQGVIRSSHAEDIRSANREASIEIRLLVVPLIPNHLLILRFAALGVKIPLRVGELAASGAAKSSSMGRRGKEFVFVLRLHGWS